MATHSLSEGPSVHETGEPSKFTTVDWPAVVWNHILLGTLHKSLHHSIPFSSKEGYVAWSTLLLDVALWCQLYHQSTCLVSYKAFY
jgi:hypothetical protein